MDVIHRVGDSQPKRERKVLAACRIVGETSVQDVFPRSPHANILSRANPCRVIG